MADSARGDRSAVGGTVIHNQGDADLPEVCLRECPHGLGYSILGFRIRIYANQPWILDRVSPFLNGFESEEVVAGQEAVRFYVRFDSSLDLPYRLVTPTGRSVESASWEPVFGYLMNQLHTWLWSRTPDVLPLHCGAVAWQGRGLLIPAASGGGKTTLALEMATAGWDYLSDEFAPICLSTLHVLPFPRRPHASVEAIKSLLGRRAERVLKGEAFLDDDGTDRYLLSISDVGSVGVPVAVSWLVFPEMSAGGPSLSRLPKAESLAMLANSALSHQYETQWQLRAIDALVSIVRRAQCCRLLLGPIGSNSGRLTALAAGEDGSIDDAVDAEELAAFDLVADRARALVQSRVAPTRGDAIG